MQHRDAEGPSGQPAKYELLVNLKTANTLGLDVPPTLSVRFDEHVATNVA